ncbi:MAG: hypothetical protein E4H26_11890, partial [Flavobacteriales bacterium]
MKPFLFVSLIIFLIGCRSDQKPSLSEEEWTPLWNGEDLSGWHTYLGTPYNRETDSLGKALLPFGIDHDPMGVITIAKTDVGNAIRITGLAWGMIYTEKEFKNYHL